MVALELLQRVAVLADLHALPDDGVEVDEHVVAQEVVDLVLARGVLDRQRPELGRLVRGVVEDVHAGVLGAKLDHAVDEPLERRLLGVGVVRPDALVAGACAPPAPQVLDAAVADVGVALEVEEDVAGARVGKQRVPSGALRLEVSVRRLAAVARPDLKVGLVMQQVEAFGRERVARSCSPAAATSAPPS